MEVHADAVVVTARDDNRLHTAEGERVTPDQKLLVQESFNGVVPIADTAVYIAAREVLTEARHPEPADA